ncbi:semaphorin-4D isoform X2 [Poecilia formosa]|uniref:semaphorin-4D isoform X2 n=1 Tax=Poecilia formosa TaxID=48698 RepID=UPI000443E035|nr:PREDICTED: semaphorin-4D isoform X2 [Poecilia formosa]XP_016530222.1 PREDICTED: semaphorin-4D isoform X2 [Poecilia formosa]XP_016530223.1 PREDICTED: semaphorin-4D isoform X2 [Poecilia formosa]XP_016530224.1 PREDICTED: semaphorin-4D isoform X2 [Poecilia formosa]XP_016530225.1 PREDICTED: semaphorin-4D isoform X2 [Poecilia formosa]
MNQYSLADAMTDKGNFTVPKLSESNMGFGVLGVFLGLLLEVSTHGPHSVPRTSWKRQDLDLLEFSEPGIFNYSTLLLSEERDALYVGARDAIFELNKRNVTVRNQKVQWKVAEHPMVMCTRKGKSRERDCPNYIRVLQIVDDKRLYICGTHAFQPQCDYLNLADFSLEGRPEDGRGKCSFDPSQSFTAVMVDGDLYSGTAYNFLGSEPIISRYSPSYPLLRTEYSTSWLNEPSFVFADVIRAEKHRGDGEDDKIYYFFTEVSVEYEFFGKLLIPRVARVCKGDLGGERTLQKKWTSFLKAKLVCSMPELNFVFNVVHDVFILKGRDWRDTVFYGVFTSQWGNVGLSAVCAYNMAAVEEVFSKGKYMQKATVEQSHTKWVRYNGIPPSPRPGACISNQLRQHNISSSLHLPDKTLQFVRDHPLLEDPVLPIGNRPRLITKDVNYTQIVVERVQALDGNIYDVIFTGTDKGVLHKSVVFEEDVHIVEEIQLLKNSEPIKNLLLSSETRSVYAGSDSGVIQSPTAFCGKYSTCDDCVLARDPYCAWDPNTAACVCILDVPKEQLRSLIQSLSGDADICPPVSSVSLKDYQKVLVKPGSSAELPCMVNSNLAHVMWKSNNTLLDEASRFHFIGENGLLIYSVAPEDQGDYQCWSVEWAPTVGKNFSRLLAGYTLKLDLPPGPPARTNRLATTVRSQETSSVLPAEGNGKTERQPLTSASFTSTVLLTTPPQTDPSLTPPPSGTVRLQPSRNIPANSVIPRPDSQDPAAEYLQHNNSVALLSLFLLFFLLFLAAMVYNCYMQYLPAPCLRLRATLLGSNKCTHQPEYRACEAGLMEASAAEKINMTEQPAQNGSQPTKNLQALRDTGYETEPECGNGRLPSHNFGGDSSSQEKPFDVDCDSQSIQFADADDAY